MASDTTNPGAGTGISLENVSFSYGEKAVLRNINLHIKNGEFVSLLGASGSGKTTLLRIIAGLEKPSAGTVTDSGHTVTAPSLQRSFVFQNYSLFPWFSLRENIALAIKKAHPELNRARRLVLARKHLELVGLADAVKKYPFELSGGMQQRGAIARALALSAPVLLMDEPFGALDPVNRSRLQDLLLSVWRNTESERKTVVFVTHDVDEAILLSDRVVMLGSSPAGIIDELQIDLPRPRSRRILTESNEFRRLREHIQNRFRADVSRALGGIVTGDGDAI